MGFPTLQQVLDSAARLHADGDEITRTNGLWHVFMFLRHRACRGNKKEYTFEGGFDLAQAAFDVNGVNLPIEDDSRNVYFEPGPTAGKSPFRHREGPRQTYLNRVYDGLAGGGPKKPRIFNVSQRALPTAVSLATDWIAALRRAGDNAKILDTRLHEFVTFIFRFGIPSKSGATAHIAEHLGGGRMELASGVSLLPLPGTVDDLATELRRFFALAPADFKALFPNIKSVRPQEWQASEPVAPKDLGAAIVGSAEPSPTETSTETGGSVSVTLPDVVEAFVTSAVEARLYFSRALVTRFIGSLLAKRFLIFTGLSGSGKTKLAQAFARWISPGDSTTSVGKCYVVVPVGADWTGNENVMGYADGLYPPKVLGDGSIEPGRYVTKPALDLMLRAMARPMVPHFLILDEMNLSHVERYFADFLSMIESGEPTTLYSDFKDTEGNPRNTRGVDPVLTLPTNVFVIGTVNVDETTYMFSPKVLDRANVLEFRVTDSEMNAFLDKVDSAQLEELDGRGESFGPPIIAASASAPSVPDVVRDRFVAEMQLFFGLQRESGAEFGFRVTYEAARFVTFCQTVSKGSVWAVADGGRGAWVQKDGDGRDWFDAAFDGVVAQKFLPKLYGSKVKLGPLLKRLYAACAQPAEDGPRNVGVLLTKWTNPTGVTQLPDPSRENSSARYQIACVQISPLAFSSLSSPGRGSPPISTRSA